ncbi:MAG TPA: hypothetical protein VF884_13865 [Nitrososphaeraceae archaeon]
MSRVVATIILMCISLVTLGLNILAPVQSVSSQVTQPGQNTGGDKIGQPEKVTTAEGTEEKIRCPNGSLADTGPECMSSDECPSEPSDNVTAKCIQLSQQRNGNNTNSTNATSIVESLDTKP